MSDERASRDLLTSLYQAAVAAAGAQRLVPFLPPAPEQGRLVLLAGGKAAAAMARVALGHYAQAIERARITGVCVTKPGSGGIDGFELIEAGHPLPDAQSQRGAARALELAQAAGSDDLVLVLLSGGASALWCAPVAGVTLEKKQSLTRALLRSGAPIEEINCVRKHLSRIKGGRLARAAHPAPCLTLAISDVAGDDPAVIASGPTCVDPTTLAEARDIIARHDIEVPEGIRLALLDPANETVKPGDAAVLNAEWRCVASGVTALAAAAALLRQRGYEVLDLGDRVTGEAREVAVAHARLALANARRRLAVLSGGELTVTIYGNGRGGPSQEYALALLIALGGAPGICALAADTDGCDGGEGRSDDPAGAFVFPGDLSRARHKLLNPATFLQHNDSGSFFAQLRNLLTSGPTGTNVNDFRVILIEGLNEGAKTGGALG